MRRPRLRPTRRANPPSRRGRLRTRVPACARLPRPPRLPAPPLAAHNRHRGIGAPRSSPSRTVTAPCTSHRHPSLPRHRGRRVLPPWPLVLHTTRSGRAYLTLSRPVSPSGLGRRRVLRAGGFGPWGHLFARPNRVCSCVILSWTAHPALGPIVDGTPSPISLVSSLSRVGVAHLVATVAKPKARTSRRHDTKRNQTPLAPTSFR